MAFITKILFLLMRDNNINGKTKLDIFGNILEQIGTNHDMEKIKEGVFSNIQARFPDKLLQIKKVVQLFFKG